MCDGHRVRNCLPRKNTGKEWNKMPRVKTWPAAPTLYNPGPSAWTAITSRLADWHPLVLSMGFCPTHRAFDLVQVRRLSPVTALSALPSFATVNTSHREVSWWGEINDFTNFFYLCPFLRCHPYKSSLGFKLLHQVSSSLWNLLGGPFEELHACIDVNVDYFLVFQWKNKFQCARIGKKKKPPHIILEQLN